MRRRFWRGCRPCQRRRRSGSHLCRHARLHQSQPTRQYQHRGVDWQALHRALRVNIRNLAFKQGGSTITMQTARYLFVGREKTLSRKVAEILLALEMEKHLSKERILELYLNSARFGWGRRTSARRVGCILENLRRS